MFDCWLWAHLCSSDSYFTFIVSACTVCLRGGSAAAAGTSFLFCSVIMGETSMGRVHCHKLFLLYLVTMDIFLVYALFSQKLDSSATAVLPVWERGKVRTCQFPLCCSIIARVCSPGPTLGSTTSSAITVHGSPVGANSHDHLAFQSDCLCIVLRNSSKFLVQWDFPWWFVVVVAVVVVLNRTMYFLIVSLKHFSYSLLDLEQGS